MIHSNHQKMDIIGGGHLHLESELEKMEDSCFFTIGVGRQKSNHCS